MKSPKVSIIIRTKNEERWITNTLESVFAQTFKDFEVIIGDNESIDKTVNKAKKYPIKEVIKITEYLPGKALNQCINNANGEYLVFLSAHCIPANSKWLENLVNALEENENYAGVYGRQEPMSFSSISDKRDMHIIFGLDRKIQKKDSFFHNANSIIRKKLWKQVQFDEKTTNIEDRIWAKEMLSKGHEILYEPLASVFHYHGIHQDGNLKRLENVVSIIENQGLGKSIGKLNAKKMNITAIIPIKGESVVINGKPLLIHTIESAKKSKFINKIIVSTDTQETANIAEQVGAECPFIRPSELSDSFVNLEAVQKYSLEQIENNNYFPDLVVNLEETFPFRPKDMIDGMINHLLEEGHDSVIAAQRESGWLWQDDKKGSFKRLDSGDVPREFKENSFIGLHGLGCVTHPEFIRNNKLLGNKIGLYKIDDPMANFEIRSTKSLELAAKLLNN